MKNISLFATILLFAVQSLNSQPAVQLHIDGEEFDGQSFSKNSTIELKVVNDDTEKEYRIDKILVEVRLEHGSPRKIRYKKQIAWALQQSTLEHPNEPYKVTVYPTRWMQSPVKNIDLSDFKELEDLCVSRIIVQLRKVSVRESDSYNAKRVSSKVIDYSKTYSLWADWSCDEAN